MTVTLVHILMVSISGLTHGLIQDHYFVDQSKAWQEARTYCRQHYSDLSSIRNDEENNLLNAAMQDYDGQSWIGYKRGQHYQAGDWSDGTLAGYTNWNVWEPNTPGGRCVAMTQNGRWIDDYCSLRKTFFCVWWHREFVLVTERLAWEEALLYCREHYTDLASVLSPEEEMHLADGEPAEMRTTEQVWTSLRYLAGQWLWVSEWNATQSQREFTQGSLPSCPAEPYTCGARVPGLGHWQNRDCQERLNFLCYRA